jgi:hypothetical protein
MGELYLDQIDRIVMREYERRLAADCPEEPEGIVTELPAGQDFPAYDRQDDFSPDSDFIVARRR